MRFESARGTMHAWQCDHMGHINVRAYLEFFDHAAWQTYAALGLTPSLLRGGTVKMAAVQQNVSYLRELQPGDTIVVYSIVQELREKVLRFRHELFTTESDELSATCEFTIVCLDAKTRKSCPFPPVVAERARVLMTEPA